MKLSSLTDIGIRREMNQDYFFASEDPVGRLPNLFIVADGMGGHNAGEFASRCAVETIAAEARATRKNNPDEILSDCIKSANYSVRTYARQHPEMYGMGTTVVAAVLAGTMLTTVNVGDSRLYLVGERIRQITRDHSLVQEMVRMGEIDERSARQHPDRNIITRAVGADEFVQADIFMTALEPGERILMCSDGLTNMVEDEEICRIVNESADPEKKTEYLVELANKNGGKDNITVILIDPELER
ncbi:MAG: Stp1/IreP family PP2C-type Ser/Thr phosphatase [Clostridiales bacterium]|nr:Stp1/IreP family PP2C-type Ser/Thr phosphatase [Clostridiales bacterium]